MQLAALPVLRDIKSIPLKSAPPLSPKGLAGTPTLLAHYTS